MIVRLLLACIGTLSAQPAAAATYRDIAPILAERCIVCHSGADAPAGLRLDSLPGLLAGGRNGPVVRSGEPAASELVRRIKGHSLPRMPMTGPPFLSDAQVALFESWVAAGLQPGTPVDAAPSPAMPASTTRPARGEPVTYAHVAPLFARHCVKCHKENGQMGAPPEGYRLDSHAAALAASDRARVVPGSPAASELLRRLRGQARPRMPFDGPPYLAEGDIGLVADWIAQGARDSQGRPAPIPVGARVRLHGRLDGPRTLDGLPLGVDGSTRRDRPPGPGTYVEVRGRIAPDGSIEVERIRPR